MTRIIAGRLKGRRLSVPSGRDVRPTTDRMRERLFSMLSHARYPAFEGARVADLFAGTGALGLEALSRGASAATFVEQARPSLKALRANIETLGAADCCKVLAMSATTVPKAEAPYDFVFMDPPYRKNLLDPTIKRLLAQGWLGDQSTLVCELASDETFDPPQGLNVLDDRVQGQQRLLILSPTDISG